MRPLLCLGLLAAVAAANGIVVRATSRRELPPVRLTEHRVTAVIRDRTASVTVEQVFYNHDRRVHEGTYMFPLPKGTAPSKFAMSMGGKMVQGEVLEAGKARNIYHTIVRTRRDPGLLEYAGRGLFRARVFPIPARGKIRIRFTYDQLLEDRNGAIAWTYPLRTERFNRQPVKTVVVHVDYQGTVDLKSVYSPSHRVFTRRMTRSAKVSYESRNHPADRDLELFFGRAAGGVGVSVLSARHGAEPGTFVAVLAPRLRARADELVPKDVVYVIDKSGSMGGRKMLQAKLALARAVRLLRPGDRFNVVAFASETERFSTELQPVTEETVFAAEAWIARLVARGSTALSHALEEALGEGEKGRLFMVVLVTDGKPTLGATKTPEMIESVKRANRADARIFTFGVGEDLDVRMLDRIAETTGGERDYIAPHENINEATARFFKRIDQPLLTDVRLTAGPGIAQTYPRRMPDLFAGGTVTVMGRYAKPGPVTFRLRGRRGDRTIEYAFEAHLRAKDGPCYLERLWAQRKLAFLLDEMRLRGASKEVRDEAVALAKKHALISELTAGLVLENTPAALEVARRFGYTGPPPRSDMPPNTRAPHDPEPPPPAPATPGGPPPRQKITASSPIYFASRKTGTKLSAWLRDQKAKAQLEGGDRVQTASGRTFWRDQKGRWIDCAWDGKRRARRVVAFTKPYFDMLEAESSLAACFALGKHVVVVWGDKVYEIVPPSK